MMSLEVNLKNVDEMSDKLEYVQGLFNKGLLQQKDTDPVFSLSEHDTIIFNELPESLRNEILSGRRIILTQPKVQQKAKKSLPEIETKKMKAAKVVKAKKTKNIKSEIKPVECRLFRDEARIRQKCDGIYRIHSNEFIFSKPQRQKQMNYLLREEAIRFPGVNSENVDEASDRLMYVSWLFNEELIQQKVTDPAFVLSEGDTIIFNELPESLKNEILSRRRIILTQPKVKQKVKKAAQRQEAKE